jgi:hypothetical protein
MVRHDPISLRIRAAASTRRARKLLQRLEAEDLQQRRIRWLATKALIIIAQLTDVAEPKLKSMDWTSRESWQKNCLVIQSILEKIKKRGV